MRLVLMLALLSVSGIRMSQERISGEFTAKEIVWPHIVQLNGPMVETNEGSKKWQ